MAGKLIPKVTSLMDLRQKATSDPRYLELAQLAASNLGGAREPRGRELTLDAALRVLRDNALASDEGDVINEVNFVRDLVTEPREVRARRLARRITARKHEGDDLYSWAVFLDGRPTYTGIGRSQVAYYRGLVLDMLLKKEDN